MILPQELTDFNRESIRSDLINLEKDIDDHIYEH